VQASLKVISDNQSRFEKAIRPKDQIELGVAVRAFSNQEAMQEKILACLREQPDLNECALICRTNKELGAFTHRLRKAGVPYQIKENVKSVFEEDWYLDVEAYLKLGLGTGERKDILRIANKPNRFITREQIMNFTSLPAPLASQVKHLKGMRTSLAMKYIWIGIGYGRYLKNTLSRAEDQDEEILEQYEDISGEMEQYTEVRDGLEYAETDRQLQLRENKKAKPQSGVYLMTMHGSKGLEYDTVILPDVNEGRMPRGKNLSKEEIEEERRLLYVAMTRAKHTLEIYYISGEAGHLKRPSMFLHRLLEEKRP
ncbi:MAG: ATP-binding domain-containing protein, partial [Lachnospiraceae bacterium]|nr:ATP-binding domain-containing protein [Lachnospiraceae bacterium]